MQRMNKCEWKKIPGMHAYHQRPVVQNSFFKNKIAPLVIIRIIMTNGFLISLQPLKSACMKQVAVIFSSLVFRHTVYLSGRASQIRQKKK